MKFDPDTVLKALNRQHPRLVLTDNRLNELKKLAQSDSVLAGYVEAVLSSADRMCEQPGIGAAMGGMDGNLHRLMVLEAYTLGLAWRWTGRDAYADRLKEDLLTDDRDRPNRAGQALLAVLAGKGTVQHKADDKGMLELCGVLTRLMGIAESPFEFAEIEEKWIALFEVEKNL